MAKATKKDPKIKTKSNLLSSQEDIGWHDQFTSVKDEMLEAIISLRAEITSRLNSVDTKLNKLTDIEKSIDYLTNRDNEITQKVGELQARTSQNEQYTQMLEERVEELSRLAITTHVEIRNVPKQEKETKTVLKDYIANLANVLKCEPPVIQNIYRWSTKKEGHPTIVVELNSFHAKQDFLRAAKVYNKNNPNKRLTASHLGIKNNNNALLYIGEKLTNKNRRLFFLGRQLVKEGSYKYCWTTNGKVYLRKSDNSTTIPIKNEDQIEGLKINSD